jgi:hypothetical protein
MVGNKVILFGIHTYIHTYIHTHTHMNIHTYVHAFITFVLNLNLFEHFDFVLIAEYKRRHDYFQTGCNMSAVGRRMCLQVRTESQISRVLKFCK